MSQEFQPEQILDSRYRILEILGDGNSGITYRAEKLNSGTIVALKVLSLRGTQNWKLVELFEREAKVLRSLNHPAIPKYLEYFTIDSDDDRHFCIVQTIAPGKTIAQWIAQGWRPTETEVRSLALQLLQILRYLHSLKPPVIHRDLKPQNIIRQPDGRIFLVDFGAVGHTYYNTLMRGSTVVGTFGYMAPEQFRSQAYPATDLYGLGATLLFILTRRSPAELPTDENLRLQFRQQIRISPSLCEWIEQLLEPDPKMRLQTANEAWLAFPKPSKTWYISAKQSSQRLPIVLVGLCLTIFALFHMLHRSQYAILNLLGSGENVQNALQTGELSLKQYLDYGGGLFLTRNSRTKLIPIAFAQQNWQLGEQWLRSGVNLYYTDSQGQAIIHHLAKLESNSLRAMQRLHQDCPGVNWNHPDRQKRTPLMLTKDEKVAIFLLERGADPNAISTKGESFLQKAAQNNWLQALQTSSPLTGVIPNPLSSAAGQQAGILIAPIQSQNLPLLKQLVQAGQRLSAADAQQIDFDHWRSFQEKQENWLITALTDINLHDRSGKTLLHYAVVKEKRELLQLVMIAGADVNAPDRQGNTALNLWAKDNDVGTDIGQILINAGAKIDSVSQTRLNREAIKRAVIEQKERERQQQQQEKEQQEQRDRERGQRNSSRY
jgi:serine/threonine protein kinase